MSEDHSPPESMIVIRGRFLYPNKTNNGRIYTINSEEELLRIFGKPEPGSLSEAVVNCVKKRLPVARVNDENK